MLDSIHKKSPVAIAITAALVAGTAALPASAQEQRLETISVQDELLDGKRVEQASSPKYTTALTDTPQTITVVTQESIAEQNLLSLRDVLSTVPGITFGAGEGGGGYGDSITLRGFAGSSDITIDGFRDSAQYTRSDPFNLEQVEVINGANSVYSGSGSVGGSVNLVSKAARLGDFNRVAMGGGTDSYGRIAGDFNRQVGDSTALRLNLMGHKNDIPGRDVENNERWGVAPSISFGLGASTTLSLSYLRQHDDNIPQYGVPTYRGRLMPGANIEAYYGYRNVDRQVNDVNAVTARFDHAFSDHLTLRNQTRWQQVDQLSIVDPPQGSWCLADGLQATGTSCGTLLPGQYQPSGPRGTTRDTRNQLIATQTDLTIAFDTGSASHMLVTGFSVASESYDRRNGNSLRNTDGATPNPAFPVMDMHDPDNLYTGPVNFIISQTTDGDLDNRALYAFDNIRLSERWAFNGGVRLERNEASSVAVNYATPATGGAASPGVPVSNNETLFSYRGGLVFKPTGYSSIYLAYGNSQTPSISTVSGTCNDTNCNVDPEKAENIELGTKWDLLGSRLSLTAAVSRNERSNYRVSDPGNPDNLSGVQVLDGSARVDALILGAAGLLADNWSVFANYTLLDSEVLQGASDWISSQGQDYTRGDPLTNVPRHAASLWTTYEPMRGLLLGYGLTYQGKVYVGQHTAAGGNYPVGTPLPTAASYTVHRVMAGYAVNRNVQLQLNVNNIFDKQYLTRVRTQQVAWATPGEARSFVLSANLSF